MNWSGGAWQHSTIPAKSSLTQKRFTPGRKSAREHWFQAITRDSARRASKPGSLSLQHEFRVRLSPRLRRGEQREEGQLKITTTDTTGERASESTTLAQHYA